MAMTGRMQVPASTVGPSSSLLRLCVASLVDLLELGLHILSKVRAVTAKNPLLLLALALQQPKVGGNQGIESLPTPQQPPLLQGLGAVVHCMRRAFAV